MSAAYYYRHFRIKADMVKSLEIYAEIGVPPGDFLRAIVSNDLMRACSYADDDNINHLPAYAAYLCSKMPFRSWGSEDNYMQWIETHQSKRAEEDNGLT